MDMVDKLVPQKLCHGYTKTGSPIYIGHFGGINTTQLPKRVTRKGFLLAHIWDMERSLKLDCKEGGKRVNVPVTELANIIDLRGMTWSVRCFFPYFKDLSVIDEANYPETMGLTFVINAPTIFSYVWKIVKPWLDPFTASKVRIHSDVPTKDLLECIDADQLPSIYGGTCKCQGGCITPINLEDTFQEYDAAIIKDYKSRLQMKETTIAPGKIFTLEFPVEKKMVRYEN